MSSVEQTSTDQRHSASAFNNACSKFERLQKSVAEFVRTLVRCSIMTSSRILTNPATRTRTALARKRLIMRLHWRAACVSLPVHCDSFVWVSSRIASYRWADAAPLAGSNFNTISPGYECSTRAYRCESAIDFRQSQVWTVSGHLRPNCWCAILPGSPPP